MSGDIHVRQIVWRTGSETQCEYHALYLVSEGKQRGLSATIETTVTVAATALIESAREAMNARIEIGHISRSLSDASSVQA
jgi:hypothetical protein